MVTSMASNIIGAKEFEHCDLGLGDMQTIEGETRYYLTPVGNLVSMTSLLNLLSDPKAIERWRKRVGEAEADKITFDAQERGNALHEYCEAYLDNRLQRSEMTHSIAKNLFGMMKQHLDRIELVGGLEQALYSKERMYAGRADAIGIVDEKLCIIDHKNSRTPIKGSKWTTMKLHKYKLQCAGYALALNEMCGMLPTHGYINVGNVTPRSSDSFMFELKPLFKDIDLLSRAYYTDDKKTRTKLLNKMEYARIKQ